MVVAYIIWKKKLKDFHSSQVKFNTNLTTCRKPLKKNLLEKNFSVGAPFKKVGFFSV